MPMKIARHLLPLAGALILLVFAGCAVHPTRANTYFAVNDHFNIGNTPYSILFGTAQPWGAITAWPVRIYTLDFRDEFVLRYPGNYLVFLNEHGDWEIIEREDLKEEIETDKLR